MNTGVKLISYRVVRDCIPLGSILILFGMMADRCLGRSLRGVRGGRGSRRMGMQESSWQLSWAPGQGRSPLIPGSGRGSRRTVHWHHDRDSNSLSVYWGGPQWALDRARGASNQANEHAHEHAARILGSATISTGSGRAVPTNTCSNTPTNTLTNTHLILGVPHKTPGVFECLSIL